MSTAFGTFNRPCLQENSSEQTQRSTFSELKPKVEREGKRKFSDLSDERAFVLSDDIHVDLRLEYDQHTGALRMYIREWADWLSA